MAEEEYGLRKFYKSFSGTDTLAFILMPDSNPVCIGSLTTISYSMFRNKKPVINIGRTNINGVTRGSRIFAGTMIFTLINQHWLRELQKELDWLRNFEELKVDELPLFDIMIVSANEYGSYVTMYIYGIDFTDEAQTISVEDLFTENTFSFVARDISTFKAGNTQQNKPTVSQVKRPENKFLQKYFILDSSNINLDEVAKLEQKFTIAKIENAYRKEKNQTLSRNLYLSTTKPLIGNDILDIQDKINKTCLFESIPINGIYDEKTEDAVKRLQSLAGLDINGIVDDRLYNFLINYKPDSNMGNITGVVINKNGSFVYARMSINSKITATKTYKQKINIIEIDSSDEDGYFQKWYKTSEGFMIQEDVYSSFYNGAIIEFPTLKYGDKSTYVTLIQNALNAIYPDYVSTGGFFDEITEKYIKKLQQDNGLIVSGIVDYSTWMLLQSLSGNMSNTMSNDNFKLEFTTPPGEYNIDVSNVIGVLPKFDTKVSCDNFINVKISTICIYDNLNSEVYSKMITVKEPQILSLTSLNKSFMYNPKFGKIPKQIDYVIYPYNKTPYKWTFKYGEK